jgi:hypothetical protein
MAFEAQVLADSISPDGVRLTTFQVTYPHAVHKDMLTHCALARNFLSFRAYPTWRLEEMLDYDPFIPEFQEHRAGMDVGEKLGDRELYDIAQGSWYRALDQCRASADMLVQCGVNKGHANILIQDFCWITGIITATEWDNFWALRAHPPDDAKPRAEVMKIAGMMHDLYESNTPVELGYGQPHVPLVYPEESDVWVTDENAIKVSGGRVARVSYLTHDGVRDPSADVTLHDRLISKGHMSPFDHQAWPIPMTGPKWVDAPDPRVGTVKVQGPDWRGKYFGWCPYRKTIPNEENYALALEA